MPLYVYSGWDGTQQVFPISGEDLMDQLSEQMVSHGEISSALRSTVQNGLDCKSGQKVPGIQDMIRRLRSIRQQAQEKYNLERILDSISRRLRDIVQIERDDIERRLDDMRSRLKSPLVDPAPGDKRTQQNQRGEMGADPSSPTPEESVRLLSRFEEMACRNVAILDNLPQQPAEIIQQLNVYEFMSDQARSGFDQLLTSLRQKVLEASIRSLSHKVGTERSSQLASLKSMLKELNGLLEEHISVGEPRSRPHYDRFMQRYGNLFGSNGPASVEQLAESLRQQMAQLESLLRSLSPELRAELEETINSLFQDGELSDELARLASNLEHMRPDGYQTEELLFRGDEPLGLEEALEVMGHLQKVDELERQFRKTQQECHLDIVEPELVRELLGQTGYQELEQLRHMAEVLENAGYIRRVGSRFELTPKGIQKTGQRALQEIFTYIRKARLGGHRANGTGAGEDLLEDTKEYQYGDPFHLHLQRSVMNAVQRTMQTGDAGSLGALPGTSVRMSPEDFEIRQTEQASQAATVLMLDLSLSMAMRGNFPAAKKVALAMDSLIRTQYPRDSLHIVGFSTYARVVMADKLAYLTWDEFDPYTNIQHGLIVARRLLAKSPGCTRQIIMISDGEPTAHMQEGQLFLQYPPSPRTIQETLKEVKRCTRQDIKINTFMLDRGSYLVDFVDQMTRINRGRVFYTSPNKLGEYILVDYITSRRRQLA